MNLSRASRPAPDAARIGRLDTVARPRQSRGSRASGVSMTAGSLALAFAAALAGAGLYVNGVEQPARLALEDQAMLSEWGPSDRRGVALMAGLALLAAIAGLSSYFETHDGRFLLGAVIAASSWPYTVFVMGPVNNQILALAPKDVGA